MTVRCLLLAVLVLAVATAPAHAADTYAVDVCSTAGGALATNAGWAHTGVGYRVADLCPGTGLVVHPPPSQPRRRLDRLPARLGARRLQRGGQSG
jgi:hypothetical protein